MESELPHVFILSRQMRQRDANVNGVRGELTLQTEACP